ncbi:MAG: histidine phosphatase family protein [Devosia sp.]|uniref:histidine phosphatase family protein n=1 Tax=Devosia sp. TaxID=1871048 RepID=UPI0024CC79AD|nr:histidine phosphatase family protein [Devosia sp.]UYO00526.1 MAG: histidine phosphatase family protein [Devosia sp.]
MPTQKPTVLVIRHGETQWNRQERLQGRLDTPLTTTGFQQAQAVGAFHRARITEAPHVVFWVSPLGRAKQTASVLSDVWQVPYDDFQIVPDLAERSYGQWEGLSRQDIRQEYGTELDESSRNPWGFAMKGGESRAELDARLANWMDSLQPGPLHVAVTHSGCLRALRGLRTNDPLGVRLTYQEPQTTSILLEEFGVSVLDVPQSILEAAGCWGTGRTVWI